MDGWSGRGLFPMTLPHSPVAHTYRMRAVLGVVTAVGLVSALIEDGVFDAVSWVLLGLPLSKWTRGSDNRRKTRTPAQERQRAF